MKRNCTKKKWRNGQRQKGSHITYISAPPTWKPKRTMVLLQAWTHGKEDSIADKIVKLLNKPIN